MSWFFPKPAEKRAKKEIAKHENEVLLNLAPHKINELNTSFLRYAAEYYPESSYEWNLNARNERVYKDESVQWKWSMLKNMTAWTLQRKAK